MKKILSLLLGIFIATFMGGVLNILFAQEEVEKVGINTSGACLMGVGKDCFKYERMMGIEDYQPGSGYTATSIAQDVVVSATYMVGTVLTIVIIVCGLGYIFSSAGGKGLFGKDPNEYKKGLVYAAIGACLVRGAYAIVRLIQYIARG